MSRLGESQPIAYTIKVLIVGLKCQHLRCVPELCGKYEDLGVLSCVSGCLSLFTFCCLFFMSLLLTVMCICLFTENNFPKGTINF